MTTWAALKTITMPEPFRTHTINAADAGFLDFQATHPAASYPEYLVFWWLTQHGYEEYRDFIYQFAIGGGRTQAGGLIADFMLDFTHPRRTILEVYGVAFHSDPVHRGYESIAQDILRKEIWEHLGFTFVRVKDTDVIDRLDYVMQHAVVGEEIAQFQG